MSTLTKRGKIWHVSYMQDGRQVRKSLGTADKSTAELLRAKLDLDLSLQANGLANRNEQMFQPIMLSAFANKYLSYRSNLVRYNTLQTDKYALAKLIQYLHNKLLNEITVADIDGFQSMIISTRSKTTLRIYLKHLNAAFNTAVQWKHLQENPIPRRQKVRIQIKRHLPYLSREEIQTLLTAIADTEFLTLVQVYLYTGARREEALVLTTDDVQSEAGLITIHGLKDSEDRALPLHPQLKESLTRHLQGRRRGDKLFVYRPDYVSKRFKKYAASAGMPEWLTIKALRRTFGSHMAQSGLDLRRLQEMMGHSDIRTTITHYAHLAKSSRVELEMFIKY
ncbi:MAG TPA: tyrosine-type recombinase/integrase [bacterium]|nr:tyrosine-type recombinase/integrase [bacterium]HPG44656.1 tyrosine-type recombinase/integrase [bacterium]HPM99437.1 tyrosine-type recombinase/integrase [bacterium]